MDRILTLTKSKLDALLDEAYNKGYADAKYNIVDLCTTGHLHLGHVKEKGGGK